MVPEGCRECQSVGEDEGVSYKGAKGANLGRKSVLALVIYSDWVPKDVKLCQNVEKLVHAV